MRYKDAAEGGNEEVAFTIVLNVGGLGRVGRRHWR